MTGRPETDVKTIDDDASVGCDMPRGDTIDRMTYRLFEERDLPQALRLWEKHSGWGGITPEQWREWYIDTPYGECLIVVAIDEHGEIAGQEVFTPAPLYVEGCVLQALRLSAPILRTDVRRTSVRRMNHPVINLYLTGMRAAIERGFKVVYALPEHAWLPFFRWLPRFATAEYRCLVRSLSEEDVKTSTDHKLYARVVNEFGEDYEKLWREAAQQFPVRCGAVRNCAWMQYKNGGHLTIEVRDAERESLVGYAAIKKRDGLIADFLARDPAQVKLVLATVIDFLVEARRSGVSALTSLKIMQAPPLGDVAVELNFQTTDYKFAFVCDSLDESVPAELIAPERWYVTPGD